MNIFCVITLHTRGIGADTQGDEYGFHYTLPSQSQHLEERLGKLAIREEEEVARQPRLSSSADSP